MLAGTNGAGKSSLGGASIRAAGAVYYNPDERSREIRLESPEIGIEEANSRAWREGVAALEGSIRDRENFAFETTLSSSNTIVPLLEKAAERGFEVRIWYAGLSSPELHLARVRQRVNKGGHDIPEAKIRERYDKSRENLIRLLPCLTALRVYDNSLEAEPPAAAPKPQLVLHWERGRVLVPSDLENTPEWAREIVAEAFKLAKLELSGSDG